MLETGMVSGHKCRPGESLRTVRPVHSRQPRLQENRWWDAFSVLGGRLSLVTSMAVVQKQRNVNWEGPGRIYILPSLVSPRPVTTLPRILGCLEPVTYIYNPSLSILDRHSIAGLASR